MFVGFSLGLQNLQSFSMFLLGFHFLDFLSFPRVSKVSGVCCSKKDTTATKKNTKGVTLFNHSILRRQAILLGFSTFQKSRTY